MDPWADGQPADVAVGNYLVSRLTGGPTQTPPPTQSSIDIAAACPVLEAWPSSVEVTAPDHCQSLAGGHWSTPGGILGGGEPLMSWQQRCWMQAPTVVYTVPSGDVFGTSQTIGVFTDDTVTLFDCRGNPKYSIEERVYHATGQADPRICEKYKSCDGTIWLQYFVYDYADGRAVAKTPYLRLFQDSFQIEDKLGGVIATVARAGDWNPVEGECGEHRKWVIDYTARDQDAVFSNPTDQWPIAEMVTIISVRDASRRPSGLLAPSGCEIRSYAIELVLAFLLVAFICSGTIVFVRVGLGPCRDRMVYLEDRICPRGIRVPSKYERD